MGIFKNIFEDNRKTNGLVLTTLAVIAFYFYYSLMDVFPAHVHAWTQSDRLAIAQCFIQNGFDLFHPCNFNLITTNGITAVDFPIYEYLVAIISKTFNLDIVIVFRSLILIYGLIGCYFIFLFARLLSTSNFKAYILLIFTITAPFFSYYLNGFLPSIPAFSNLFIGIYFLTLFFKNGKYNNYLISISFISLSALVRLPYSIALIALLALIVIRQIRHKKFNFKILLPPILGIILVGAYFFYNQYLSHTYGNIFLSSFLNIDSLDTLNSVLAKMNERWLFEYFSPYHYGLLLLLLGFSIYQITKKIKDSRLISIFLFFSGIYSIGSILFFVVMGKQFVDHDYYFMDSFFPIFIILAALGISYLQIPKKHYSLATAILIIFGGGMIAEAKSSLKQRYIEDIHNRSIVLYNAYVNSDSLLTANKVGKDDKILVIDAYSTNAAFLLMKRSGLAIMNTDSLKIKEALKFDFDYVTMMDTFLFSDVIRYYPNLMYQLDFVARDKNIRLYKRSENLNTNHFFNELYASEYLNFGIDSGKVYQNFSNYSNNQNGHLELNPSIEFGLTYEKSIENNQNDWAIDAVVQADYYLSDSNSTATLVFTYGDVYQSYYIQNHIDSIAHWQTLQFRIKLPYKEKENLKIYLWNSDRTNMWYDNFRVIVAK